MRELKSSLCAAAGGKYAEIGPKTTLLSQVFLQDDVMSRYARETDGDSKVGMVGQRVTCVVDTAILESCSTDAVQNGPSKHYYDLGLISKLPPRLE